MFEFHADVFVISRFIMRCYSGLKRKALFWKESDSSEKGGAVQSLSDESEQSIQTSCPDFDFSRNPFDSVENTLDIARKLHSIAHDTRDFARDLEKLRSWDELIESGPIGRIADRICERVSCLTGILYEKDIKEYHSTLKLVIDPKETDAPRLGTIGRSPDFGTRDRGRGRNDEHAADANSDFSALFALNDGERQWPKKTRYQCFICNDCTNPKYKCDREKYAELYKSVLNIPARYEKHGKSTPHVLGILTIDVNYKDGFPDLPDIFEHQSPTDFQFKCHESFRWNLLAMIADDIGKVLMMFHHRMLSIEAQKSRATEIGDGFESLWRLAWPRRHHKVDRKHRK